MFLFVALLFHQTLTLWICRTGCCEAADAAQIHPVRILRSPGTEKVLVALCTALLGCAAVGERVAIGDGVDVGNSLEGSQKQVGGWVSLLKMARNI